jgi:Arc/MetJ-type ribon-helix-helix transcriptional regulator
MTQIAVKIPDQLLDTVDHLVGEGRFDSRSHAVRAGLEALVRLDREKRTDLAFARGFERHPERPEELADAARLAVDAINDEPWEPWW